MAKAFSTKLCLLAGFVLLLFTKLNAQITYDNYLSKSQLTQGSVLTVSDPDSAMSGAHRFVKRNQYVSLNYTAQQLTDVQNYTAWSYGMVLKIMNGYDTSQYFLDTLSIQRNDSTPIYRALNYYNLTWASLRVRVLDICGKTGIDSTCVTDPDTYPLIPEDIYLEAAIIHTGISGFSFMNPQTGTSTAFDPDIEKRCEDIYDERFEILEMESKAALAIQINDFANSLGIDTADVFETEQLIFAAYQQLISDMADSTVQADLLYLDTCANYTPDSLILGQIGELSEAAFFNNTLLPYFSYILNSSRQLFNEEMSYSAFADADSVDALAYANAGFEAKIMGVISLVSPYTAPGFAECYFGQYMDTVNNWSARGPAIIKRFQTERRQLFNDIGMSDSLYLYFKGGVLNMVDSSQAQFMADEAELIKTLYHLCGFNREGMANCHLYYDGLDQQAQFIRDSISYSFAKIAGLEFGVNPDYLFGKNQTVTTLTNNLLAEYTPVINHLDSSMAACTAIDPYYASLQDISGNLYTIPALFLSYRQTFLTSTYRNTSTMPDSVSWNNAADSLILLSQAYAQFLLEQRREVMLSSTGVDTACVSFNYVYQDSAFASIVYNMLTEITPLFDSMNVYGGASSYRYEAAYAKWKVDKENSTEFSDINAVKDSLLIARTLYCPKGSYTPGESIFSCLQTYDARIRKAVMLNSFYLASLDSVTSEFRGIINPMGWHRPENDLLNIHTDLLEQYKVHSDSLFDWAISLCITDSMQYASFVSSSYLSEEEEFQVYNTGFMANYNAILNGSEDVLEQLNTDFSGVQANLGASYGDYFGDRMNAKFQKAMGSVTIDSVYLACFSGLDTSLGGNMLTLINGFLTDLNTATLAGYDSTITGDSSAYAESVLFYSLLKNFTHLYIRTEIDSAVAAKDRYCTLDKAKDNQSKTDTYNNNSNGSKPQTGDDDEGTSSAEEAEIAACQQIISSEIETRSAQLYNDIYTKFRLAFDSDSLGDEHLGQLVMTWLDTTFGKLVFRSLDSILVNPLNCSADSGFVNALHIQDALQRQLNIEGSLAANPPAHLFLNLFTLEDSVLVPDFSSLSGILAADSVFFGSLVNYHFNALSSLVQSDNTMFPNPDSCFTNYPDSLLTIHTLYGYNLWANNIDLVIQSIHAGFDSSVISLDSLSIKLRWLNAIALVELYDFATNYLPDAMQRFEDCSLFYATEYVLENSKIKTVEKEIPKQLSVSVNDLNFLTPMDFTFMGQATSVVTVEYEQEGSCAPRRFVHWDPIPGALEYDLEWAYIDDEIYINNVKANTLSDIQYRAFSITEPIRITTAENKFPFPEEYPNGKLYFRVRGVARIVYNSGDSYDQPQFFPWAYNWEGYDVSTFAVTFNGSNPFNNTFENNLNWQWETSYAEEGKFKRVISYYDGLNRPNQVVTHLSTDNLSVIGETLYDHEGRAAVQVLPYPESCYELSYRSETREDMDGNAFDREDFELDASDKEMNSTRGASEYYSGNNPFLAVENPLMHMGTLPDAQYYPYTQTAFMRDNTGRPQASGGVGPTHNLFGEHATRYLYNNANETELRRLFGRNVGNASHYKKNAVIDANGQLSIAYVDQEGRTIATALAGLHPSNLIELDADIEEITVNLTQNNISDPITGTSNIVYQHLNTIPDNEYEFSYTIGIDAILDQFYSILPATPKCVICEYDLEVFITGPDGEIIQLDEVSFNGSTPTGLINKYELHINNAEAYGLAEPCFDMDATSRTLTFKATFPDVATYTIHKILTWDEQAALDALTEMMQPENNTDVQDQLTSLITTYQANVDLTQCDQFQTGGISSLPQEILDDLNDMGAFETECNRLLNEMVHQITPWQGAGQSPVPHDGQYAGDTEFWNTVADLIEEGIDDPTNSAYISPEAVAAFEQANPNATAQYIKNNASLWTWELKLELAKAHPEYCWYTKCLIFSESLPYDLAMTEITTLTEGRAEGYMNPMQGSTSLDGYTDIPNTGSAKYDPLQSNSTYRDRIQDLLEEDDDQDYNLWERTDNINSLVSGLSSTELDELKWQIFRGGYLQAKSDVYYTNDVNGCLFLEENWAIVEPPADLPDNEEDANDFYETNAPFFEADGELCQNTCAQNVEAWIVQLFQNCPGIPEASIDIYGNIQEVYSEAITDMRLHLGLYCLENCGMQNPMGIITDQMLSDAMNSQEGHLYEAMQIFEDEFNCEALSQSGSSWTSTFTYGEGEYTENCNTQTVSLSALKILKLIGHINDALDDMAETPGTAFILQPMVTSGGLEIGASVNHAPFYSNWHHYYGLNVYDCNVPNAEPPGIPPCSIAYFADDNRGPIHYDDIFDDPLYRKYVREIINIDWNSLTYESSGDITLNVDFVTHGFTVDSYGNYIWDVSPTEHSPIPGQIRFNIGDCCDNEICTIWPNPWVEDIDPEDLEEECEEELLAAAEVSAQNDFNTWLQEQINNLWSQVKCELKEDMHMTYETKEHHYTLYYYDQAGNLTQTVPPQGVHPLEPESFNANGTWIGTDEPEHDMESRYKFNSLNVAIESETPDGGLTLYKPDLMGRPDESINAEQRKRALLASTTTGSPDYGDYVRISSRTLYDNLGRIDSVFEQKVVAPQSSVAGYYPQPFEPGVATTRTQLTITGYDSPVSVGVPANWIAQNTRSRVAKVEYRETETGTLKHGTYYSYDIHGNVKSMLTDVPALSSFNQRFRRVDYYYDLISGKVNEVHYQPKRGDRFYHRYTYDGDNRLITAETSRDYMLWERDAKYYYYPHGPLKRVETGHRKVQGSDYFYTLHGWLKGVNSGALNETYDAGRDGDINLSLNPHAMVARDAYGFTLDYYDSHNGSPGDYTPVGSGMNHIPVMGGDFAGAILEDGLFNGNIVRMGTALLKPDETRLDVLGKAYRYDQLNRICVDTSFLTGNLHAGNSWSGVSGSMAFYGRYSYDANGNILGLQRHNAAGTLIDDFTYAYQSKPAPASLSQYNYVGPQNRLDYVGDPATGGMDGQSAGNYAYDEIGNLVKDETEEIAEIKWTVYGKVRAVVREAGSTKPDLDFAYTASGQRYLKVVKPKNPDGSLKNSGFWTFTYYQHDAQGNVLAVYDIKNADEECGYEMYLDQLVLYGSSRLGVLNQKLKMGTMEHSFPGYGGPGMYVCLDELVLDDDLMLGAVPATSPGEIFNQSPGGKIEAAKPWELVQNPATVKPLTVFGVTNPPINVAGPAKEETKYEPGHKQYEFSNHLGNVLVTVSDMPLGVDVGNDGNVDYYMPDVKTTSDYEPFGAPLEGRTLSENGGYDFGFNGQMKDDEVYGEGNSYTAEYWQYDPRLGRRWNVDPVYKHYMSNYSSLSCNPIIFIDPNGAADYYTAKGEKIGSDNNGGDGKIYIVTENQAIRYIRSQTKVGMKVPSDSPNLTGTFFALPSYEDRQHIKSIITEAKRNENNFKRREYGGFRAKFTDGTSMYADVKPGNEIGPYDTKAEIEISPKTIADESTKSAFYAKWSDMEFVYDFTWHTHTEAEWISDGNGGWQENTATVNGSQNTTFTAGSGIVKSDQWPSPGDVTNAGSKNTTGFQISTKDGSVHVYDGSSKPENFNSNSTLNLDFFFNVQEKP